ncbi:MAG: hypothetical protein FJW37_07890, partial [Acidobacteria bacterium]|nr:hypothetical protein [Acidobacteriota bacterium]
MIRPSCLRPQALAPLLLMMLVACAGRDPGDPLRPGFNVYSKEQDIALGRQAAAEIRPQLDIVQDQQLQSYIDRVGRGLASTSAADTYPYEFTLVNDGSINAFALPGGPIFVNTGLLRAAENETQTGRCAGARNIPCRSTACNQPGFEGEYPATPGRHRRRRHRPGFGRRPARPV